MNLHSAIERGSFALGKGWMLSEPGGLMFCKDITSSCVMSRVSLPRAPVWSTQHGHCPPRRCQHQRACWRGLIWCRHGPNGSAPAALLREMDPFQECPVHLSIRSLEAASFVMNGGPVLGSASPHHSICSLPSVGCPHILSSSHAPHPLGTNVCAAVVQLPSRKVC